MNVKDLKCYPQVVAVIGEALADYELGRVIDSDECEKGDHFRVGFYRIFSPQGEEFWKFIFEGQNPYDHGHEKPEIKEWAYIRDTVGSNRDEWHFKHNDGWIDSDDCYCNLNNKGIEILATRKSVTMPDWVPDITVPKSEHGDTIEPSEKLKAAFDKPANKYKVPCKGVEIDVYDVLLAYSVTNPADQHAIKKMLMPGKRGVKDANQDRKEAIQSLERAIELASTSE